MDSFIYVCVSNKQYTYFDFVHSFTGLRTLYGILVGRIFNNAVASHNFEVLTLSPIEGGLIAKVLAQPRIFER